MPFAATWMELETIILSEVKSERKRQISCAITYMWNLKYDTKTLIYETETDSQTQRTDLWFSRGKHGTGGINQKPGINTNTLTTIYKIDNQQGPTVQHKELYSIFCDNLYEKRI